MERLRKTLDRTSTSGDYAPLSDEADGQPRSGPKKRFSWIDYSIFLLLGISMLWAWNMFLAASPYFQHRFAAAPRLLSAFSPSFLSIATVTNLVAMLTLTHLQAHAHYPHRINLSLGLNICAFTLLAFSTVLFKNVSPGVYFAFLMIMVFVASLAAALCQNGVFAYVSGFGVGEYTQAIMTGQAVAGVLPCLAQIISVLSVPVSEDLDSPPALSPPDGLAVPQQSGKSAFAYFLTATGISALTFFAFSIVLQRRHPGVGTTASSTKYSPILDDSEENLSQSVHEEDYSNNPTARKTVSLWVLYRKLHWLANSVFLTFCITMFFPVFTQQITSVNTDATTVTSSSSSRLLQAACFIPLAFLFWNTGDLLGRLATLLPSLAAFVRYPKTVMLCSVARAVWIPLYLLCNIHGRGAIVPSDAFYLVVVQLLFGLTNGFLGSICMMAPAEWVEPSEREAAGGFMGLMLVAGLTLGSLLSFSVA